MKKKKKKGRKEEWKREEGFVVVVALKLKPWKKGFADWRLMGICYRGDQRW
jgi:hypothetical protein